MCVRSNKRALQFNFKMNFLDYNKMKSRVLFGGELTFIPKPINEVRLELFHDNDVFSTFKLNTKGKLEILKRKTPRELGYKVYNPLSIDQHLYILRETIREDLKKNLEEIILELFKKRSFEPNNASFLMILDVFPS